MARPDRVPVSDALDVVPHPVAVDQPRAGCLGDADHAAVDMFGHAGDHELRRLAQALRPVLPDQIMIAADAAGGDDHGLRAQREIADHLARRTLAALDVIRLEDRTADAFDRAVGHQKCIDAVAKLERQSTAPLGFARAALERLDNAGAGAPGDVKARHRIAVAHRVIAAALGPADHRKDTVPHCAQPVALFAGGEGDIGFRPFPRPMVVVAVEARGAHPVLQREIVGILDAQPALFGGIDQKQSAERPKGLSAEALLAFLVEHNDALAGDRRFRSPRPAPPVRRRPRLRLHRQPSRCPQPFSIQDCHIPCGQRQMVLACGYAATLAMSTCSSLGPFRAKGAAPQQHLI